MSQSDTKNLQKVMGGLDASDIISIMERLHAAAVSGQLQMTPRDPQSKQAIEAVIKVLETDRAKLDALLHGFTELYSGTALSPAGPAPNGSDIPKGGAPPGAKAPIQTASETEKAAPAPKHQYYRCPVCEMWAKPGVSHRHNEEEARAEDCFNGFFAEELDIIHGPEGWEKIDPPTGQQASKPEKGFAEDSHIDDDPEQFGLRHNSKLYRVYMIAKELLTKNDSFHIDTFIEAMAKAQMFIGVQNRRANAANFLSKLKARGLLDSDNRGFWFLPRKKAAK